MEDGSARARSAYRARRIVARWVAAWSLAGVASCVAQPPAGPSISSARLVPTPAEDVLDASVVLEGGPALDAFALSCTEGAGEPAKKTR